MVFSSGQRSVQVESVGEYLKVFATHLHGVMVGSSTASLHKTTISSHMLAQA